MSREIGRPTTGVTKLHPGTSYQTQIVGIGMACIIEVELSGSMGITIDGSVPRVCFGGLGYAEYCKHVVRKECHGE